MYKIILLSLLSINAFATFDLATILSFRTYPSVGGEASVEAGKNILLYGQGKGSSPVYGLLRPSLKLGTSAVINTYDASIELFPISFIGLHIGHTQTKSDFDKFSFFDCKVVSCKGDIKREYVGQKMALAYKKLVLLGQSYIYKNTYKYDSDTDPVGEFRYFSLANAKRDQNYFSRYAVGLSFKNELYLLVSEYNRFAKSNQVYKMHLLTYIKKMKANIFTFGVGNSKSTHVKEGFSAVFQWKHVFSESQKLF